MLPKYEVVDFDGVWACVEKYDGTFLVDPKFLDEFLHKYKEKESSD